MSSTNDKVICSTTLHWIGYRKQLIYVTILTIIYLALLLNVPKGEITNFAIVTLIYFVFMYIYGSVILRQRKIEWTVTDKQVCIKRTTGGYYYLDPSQIHEVTYGGDENRSYGSVIIQKNDNNGSYESQDFLRNHKQTYAAIKQLVDKYKIENPKQTTTIIAQNNSVSKIDELEKLIELKNKGKITDAEYNDLKAKLL